MGGLRHGGGHRRHLPRLLAGVAAAHPAALVAGRLVPGSSAGTDGAGGVLGVVSDDLPTALVQLALVATIVGAVSFGDRLVAVLTAAFRAAGLRCPSLRQETTGPQQARRTTRPVRRRERHGPGAVARRGPPAVVLAR